MPPSPRGDPAEVAAAEEQGAVGEGLTDGWLAEEGNRAAQALFAGAGLVRSHGYRYRTAPLS